MEFSLWRLIGAVILISTSALLLRLVQNVYFHPLAKYRGPWYACATSLVNAIASVLRKEPEWLMALVKSYGVDGPIRIAPNMLLFPQPEALQQIYWDPDCNFKSELYGTGALGPPHLFTTRDREEHRHLRKALGGPQWSIGALKNNWETRMDDEIRLFVDKMTESAGTVVLLSDKVAEFAADIMTMVAFTKPWGFVANGRDERQLLRSWRNGLNWFGFVGRWTWFRNNVLKNPLTAPYCMPSMTDEQGMGFLMAQADRSVTEREAQMESGEDSDHRKRPDFLQYCLDARHPVTKQPLTPIQKRAHTTLLIQAGADTTGTALGCTLRFLLVNPNALEKARLEVDTSAKTGKLSTPVTYEESRTLLPYIGACIQEALRLNPPATNLFARLVPAGGKTICGVFVPGGTEVTSHAYVVQRDPTLYLPDPEVFRPERWLEAPPELATKMEASSFVFGMGSRVCLGKDIAIMELWKLVPEVIREFNMKLVGPGKYVVAGGVAYNHGLFAELERRLDVLVCRPSTGI